MRMLPLLIFVAFGLAAAGQSGNAHPGSARQGKKGWEAATYTSMEQESDDLRQELDRDAVALSRVPADPVLAADPFAVFLGPLSG